MTVGVTAAPSVVVMNRDEDYGGRHQPNFGDDGRATTVTFSNTKQTGATLMTVGATAVTSVVVMNATTITATTAGGSVGMASVLATTLGGAKELTRGSPASRRLAPSLPIVLVR